ncbi:MAG: hypothetical protein AB1Z98_33565 [Nannocystaceae bacterium]
MPWWGLKRRATRCGPAALALALAGCPGSSGDPLNSTGDGGPVEVPTSPCLPGETQPCACPDELDGLRTCDATGSAFGECDCSPGAVSQGPLLTGTESGTGSGSDGTAGSTTTGDTTGGGPGSTSGPDPTTGDPPGTTSTGPGPGSASGGTSGGTG